MRGIHLPSTKAAAHEKAFCDVANITMSILERRMKLNKGLADFTEFELYMIHQITKDDFLLSLCRCILVVMKIYRKPLQECKRYLDEV